MKERPYATKDYRIRYWKKNYLFRIIAMDGMLPFFGMQLPVLFPGNTKNMIALLQKTADIDVFDCCGNNCRTGDGEEEKLIIDRMEKSFQRLGLLKLLQFCLTAILFKPRLSVHILSIYEKLSQLSLERH